MPEGQEDHVPNCDQRRHDESVDLNVERIERAAAEAGPKRAPLLRAQLAVPIEHPDTIARIERQQNLGMGTDISAMSALSSLSEA
jgi:hypothetical protein